MKKLKILNSKGQNIAAVVHYPTVKTDKLAILCPGQLDTKDYTHLVKLAEALSEQGYTAVRFDSTGTWESEGDISEYTTTQYLDDVKSVLEHMLREANYSQILLGGHSRGGMISILYAARDKRISTVLGIMPSNGRNTTQSERERWQEENIKISKRDIPGSDEFRTYKLPYSHLVDRDKYDVLADVKKINALKVFITGELDTIILPESVKQIYDEANEPKKFIMLQGIGHDYRHNLKEIDIVNKKILYAMQ